MREVSYFDAYYVDIWRVHMQELDDKSKISFVDLFQYLTLIALNTFRRMQTRHSKSVPKSVVIQKQPFIYFELAIIPSY